MKWRAGVASQQIAVSSCKDYSAALTAIEADDKNRNPDGCLPGGILSQWICKTFGAVK
jgi:hypothetical protein